MERQKRINNDVFSDIREFLELRSLAIVVPLEAWSTDFELSAGR
jgi:hypothetical protein